MSLVQVGPAPASGPVPLSKVSGEGPAPLYRIVYTLSFDVGDAATGVRMLTDAPVFRGTFLPRVVEVTFGDAPGEARRSGLQGGVKVELPHRRRIQRLDLADSAPSDVGQLRLFRLDEGTPADTSTARANVPSSGRALPGAFTDVVFLVRGYEGDGDADDDWENLSPSDLEALRVRSYPTGPRIGLAAPAPPPVAEGEEGVGSQALEEVVHVLHLPGEHPDPVEVDVGPALVGALQEHLDRRLAGGASGTVEVALVVESDAPCRFRVDEGPTLEYQVRAGELPGGDRKLVLRFSESEGFRHTFPVVTPGSGTVAEGWIVTAPSFRGRVPVDPGAPGAAPTESGPPAPWDRGAILEAGRWVAQRIPLQSSVATEGLLLAIFGLGPSTELLVQVREDRKERPAGRPLAETTASVTGAGRPLWVRATPPGGLRLDPPAVWLLVTARDGSAVWLAESAGTGAPARILPATDVGPDLGGGDVLEALRCVHRIVPSRPVPDAPGAPGGGSEGPEGESSFILEIGGAAVPPLPADPGNHPPGRTVFDITAALAGALGPAGPEARSVEVVVSALASGMLTVYPPELRMEG